MSPLLEIRDLSVELLIGGVLRPVIHDVSLSVAEGATLGLVGESGSGKSMTARAVTRLLPPGARAGGEILFDGQDVLRFNRSRLRSYRSHAVATVFQDPSAAINPVHTVGDFLTEPLRVNRGMSRRSAEAVVLGLLDEVSVDNGARRLRQYPHELSGGLLQRVMIAGALALEPRLLLADEPTTALDVTTQAEVMAILSELQAERGLALLFITHDLDLASAVCNWISVMYAGRIVETRTADLLHDRPSHPYTEGLAAARPSITESSARLNAIPGRPVSAFEAGIGCAFAPRCAYADEQCTAEVPALRLVDNGTVRCIRPLNTAIKVEAHGR